MSAGSVSPPGATAHPAGRASPGDRGTAAGMIGIVDDDYSVRRALQRLLRAMGFEVAGYASAEEFLVAARLRDFDCLLLDIQLRGMSGLDLYAALQRLEYPAPVIFISATADAASAVTAQTEGRGLFLCKPVDADQLGEALACRLDARESA